MPVVGIGTEHFKSRSRNSTGAAMTCAQTQPLPGTAPALEVSSGEAWMFLELYRAREGQTREELHSYKEAFARVMGTEVESFREDDSAEITHHQTWMALRWLGWRVPKEVLQHLIGLVDLDSSGCLNLKEFLKLMRLVREREDEELHGVRRAMGLPFADLFEVVHVDIAKRMLSDLGFPESVDIRATLRALGIKPEQGAPKYSGPRSFGLSVRAERRLDWISLIRVVRHLRSQERADRRKIHGFTPEEVKKWTVIFSQCANKRVVIEDSGEKVLESSTLRAHVFLRLLEEEYAPALFHGVDLRDIQERLLALEVASDHDMDVKGFLKMMSEVHEDADVRYHSKLQRAEESCRFSAQEVREFQAIFVKSDIQEAGLLPFSQVVEIVNGLIPLKAVHVAELYAVWEEVVSALDAESIAGGLGEATQLPQKPAHYSRLAAHAPGSTDFPEFLCFMERLIAMDFQGIIAKTVRRTSKMESERRALSRRSLRRQAVFQMPEEDGFSWGASAAVEAAYPRASRAEGGPAGFGLG
jgi:Ca2+-binding EF-hand superfamily protein